MTIKLADRFLLWAVYILACYVSSSFSQIRVHLEGAGVSHKGTVIVSSNLHDRKPVCDDSFNMPEANAVCVALGFPRALRFTQRDFYSSRSSSALSSDGWKSLNRLECPTKETSEGLQGCNVYSNTEERCTAQEIAGVECQTDSTDYGCSPNDFICNRGGLSPTSNVSSLCISRFSICDGIADCPDGSDEADTLCNEEGIIRLKSNRMTELPEGAVAGTIFVKQNSRWGTIYGLEADVKIAQVACRMLGYGKGVSPDPFNDQHRGTFALFRAYFGEGYGSNIGGRDIKCKGDELTLSQCPGFDKMSTSLTDHFFDLGVLCVNGRFSVQLVDGPTRGSGRLELQRVGYPSATICDNAFDDLDAQVVCRELGYESHKAVALKGAPFGKASKVMNLILDCDGDERSINDCRILISSKPCNHRQTAAVICDRENTGDEVLRSLLPTDCGIPVDASSRFLTRLGKVRGGTVPSRFDIPWLAQLRIRDDGIYDHTCGAVIISEFYLLTAAHCMEGVGRLNLIVSIGNFNNNYNDPTQQDFFIDKIRVHENYEEIGFADNDIALIKIEAVNGRGIRFGERVKPVCLPRIGETYEKLSSCQISGWGVEFNSPFFTGPSSVVPRAAPIAVSSDTTCERLYGSGNYSSSFVCFGGQDLKITCPGDSGGPLTCIGDKGRHVLYGLNSNGLACSRFREIPKNYARVTKYLRWIQEQIVSINNG